MIQPPLLGPRRTKRPTALSLLFALSLSLLCAPTAHAAFLVWDGIPDPDPDDLPSLGFQALSTYEFGDRIEITDNSVPLDSVRVAWKTFAIQSRVTNGTYTDPNVTYTQGDTHWLQDLTVNFYDLPTNPNLTPNLLGSVTQSFEIPMLTDQQVIDGGGPDIASLPVYGLFDVSGLELVVPKEFVIGFTFNTQDFGDSPTGFVGPYNSLNIALAMFGDPDPQPFIGIDPDNDEYYWDSDFALTHPEFVAVDFTAIVSNRSILAIEVAIPEPSRALLLLCGTLAATLVRRRAS
ncbi:MAG: hypothetical protein AAF591_02290 [Verrucomicrobiota bacterium]